MIEQYARNMAHLFRWAIVRVTRKQSLAEHSFFVALITARLIDAFHEKFLFLGVNRANMLEWCLMHDMDELITGDLPTPVKKALVEGYVATEYLSKIFPWWKDKVKKLDIGAEEKAIIKVADLLEAILFTREEVSLGNQQIEGHFEYLMNKLDSFLQTATFSERELSVIHKFVSDSVNDTYEAITVVNEKMVSER